jgi:hypothetical protein
MKRYAGAMAIALAIATNAQGYVRLACTDRGYVDEEGYRGRIHGMSTLYDSAAECELDRSVVKD